MAGSTNDKNKVAIVTGSTQGLGEAIALRLVDEGLIGGLVICGRSAENDRLARQLLWSEAELRGSAVPSGSLGPRARASCP
jgi:NAD(P)-dependent dehydrogenase (short-subunit alcohol dehydrogenase family)